MVLCVLLLFGGAFFLMWWHRRKGREQRLIDIRQSTYLDVSEAIWHTVASFSRAAVMLPLRIGERPPLPRYFGLAARLRTIGGKTVVATAVRLESLLVETQMKVLLHGNKSRDLQQLEDAFLKRVGVQPEVRRSSREVGLMLDEIAKQPVQVQLEAVKLTNDRVSHVFDGLQLALSIIQDFAPLQTELTLELRRELKLKIDEEWYAQENAQQTHRALDATQRYFDELRSTLETGLKGTFVRIPETQRTHQFSAG